MVAAAARSREGRIIALDGEAGFQAEHPARRPALRLLPVAVPHPQGAAGDDRRGQDRLRLRARRRSRCRRRRRSGRSWRATTSRTPAAFLTQRRPARPPARHPARGRLRHQPGAVRGHHRGPRLQRPDPGERRGASTATGRGSCRRCDGFDPVVIGHGAVTPQPTRGRPVAASPTRTTPSASSRCTTARRSSSGEIIAPEVARRRRPAGPQLLPGPGGVPGPGRPARQAAPGAHRRHVLHQPLVRHRRAAAEDGDPDRLRRRGGVVLRLQGRGPHAATPFRYGEQVEPGHRGVWKTRAASGQVPAQPVRAEGRARADGELRPALDHRRDRGAPVRQGPDEHRADHGRRLRADAAAVAGAAHRLREGAARGAAVRRRQAADQPDARPDPVGVLPRRGAEHAACSTC